MLQISKQLTSLLGCKDSWFQLIFETPVKLSVTKAFGMEAPSNLKLLDGGGLAVGEAYDPFNSNPQGSVGGGGLTHLGSFLLVWPGL